MTHENTQGPKINGSIIAMTVAAVILAALAVFKQYGGFDRDPMIGYTHETGSVDAFILGDQLDMVTVCLNRLASVTVDDFEEPAILPQCTRIAMELIEAEDPKKAEIRRRQNAADDDIGLMDAALAWTAASDVLLDYRQQAYAYLECESVPDLPECNALTYLTNTEVLAIRARKAISRFENDWVHPASSK